jgi:DHA1 family multidrug resistance protein-like MFS transporter
MAIISPSGGGRVGDPQAALNDVDWKRNLAILCFAQFISILSFSFCFPFIPLFLQNELGVTDRHELAVWSGLCGGASGFALSLVSPVWGLAADRWGRKPMVIRAMVAGGFLLGAMGLARTPVEVVIIRVLQGAFSGTVAAAITLVATGTPRQRVGWAMGLLSSAVALGSAAGPFIGGVAASLLGLRTVFLIGCPLMLAAVLPVILIVREPPLRAAGQASARTVESIRNAGPGAFAAIGVLLLAQTLIQIGFAGSQLIVPLKLIQLAGTNATGATGVAFAAAGVASAVAAIGYSRLAGRIGYRWLSAIGGLVAAFALALMAQAPTEALVVVAIFLAGLCFGAVGPATSAMLGLEAPPAVQGRIFGLSASATAVGWSLGPLIGGTMAGVLSISIALYTLGGFSVALALMMTLLGREPAR